MTTYDGECFCGAVKVEVLGEPEAMGYCHCRSCRSWSGGPVNAFTLWKPDAVRIAAGFSDAEYLMKRRVATWGSSSDAHADGFGLTTPRPIGYSPPKMLAR